MDTKEKEILDVAEKMVRKGGYNAFSFRDIAKEVGIKSSSVHYHFPTKEDLGAAVASYYTEKFLNALGEPKALISNKKDPIKIYIQAFRDALIKDKHMCLCGLLGAEVDGLPPKVATQAKEFFERNIEWLNAVYTLKGLREDSKEKALQTIALLEGAMIVCGVLNDRDAFDQIISELLVS